MISINKVSLPFLPMFVLFGMFFPFAMIAYIWCEQIKVQVKTLSSWIGVDLWHERSSSSPYSMFCLNVGCFVNPFLV